MATMDVVTLFPTNLKGTLSIPTSKSLTHRALICAALSKGKSTITNVVMSEDIKATIHALEQIGAKFTKDKNAIIVRGIKNIKVPSQPIDCNESGSTLRFLIPLLSLPGKAVEFTGKKSLSSDNTSSSL